MNPRAIAVWSAIGIMGGGCAATPSLQGTWYIETRHLSSNEQNACSLCGNTAGPATQYATTPPACDVISDLYLGLMNQALKPFHVGEIKFASDESDKHEPSPIPVHGTILPGEMWVQKLATFVYTGKGTFVCGKDFGAGGVLDKGDNQSKWKCRLPAAVVIVDSKAPVKVTKVQMVNVMPTSLPQYWDSTCTVPTQKTTHDRK